MAVLTKNRGGTAPAVWRGYNNGSYSSTYTKLRNLVAWPVFNDDDNLI